MLVWLCVGVGVGVGVVGGVNNELLGFNHDEFVCVLCNWMCECV